MTTIPDDGPIRYQAVEYAARELLDWNISVDPVTPRFLFSERDYLDIVQVVLDALEQYAGDR